MVGNEAGREYAHVFAFRSDYRRRPILVIEEVVERDGILDETLPLVQPLAADNVPDSLLPRLERLSKFLCLND